MSGPTLPPTPKSDVALLAGLGEDGPAERRGRCGAGRAVSIALHCGDQLRAGPPACRGRCPRPRRCCSSSAGVAEVAELADEVGRHVGRGHRLGADGVEQRLGVGRARRRACSTRVALLGGAERRRTPSRITAGVFGSSNAARPRRAAPRSVGVARAAAGAPATSSVVLRAERARRARPAAAVGSAFGVGQRLPQRRRAPPGRRTSTASACASDRTSAFVARGQLAATRPASPPASPPAAGPSSAVAAGRGGSASRVVGVVGLRRARRPACASASGVPIAAMRRAMNGSSGGTFASAASSSARAGSDVGQRLGGVPVHQRQVVVAGVLGVRRAGRRATSQRCSSGSRCRAEAR